MSKLNLGQVVATSGIADFVSDDIPRNIALRNLLIRHANGDWGDVDEEDHSANDIALLQGNRVLSSYRLADRKVWVITDADRSSTTVLFPEEY